MFKTKFNTLSATYRIVTPMFLGDADQRAERIRPPSVKGVLRFWWRALNWARFRGEHGEDAAALRALYREECRLFGSSPDGDAKEGGQSRFQIRITQPNTLTTQREDQAHRILGKSDYAAARYLAYGLMEAFASAAKGTKAGQLLRDCIDENQRFTVTLTFPGEERAGVDQALIALGTLGGLGSRSRRGMGSLMLEKLVDGQGNSLWNPPTDRQSYIAALQTLLKGKFQLDALPPFSAFCRYSRLYVLDEFSGPYAVLNDFGRGMVRYRSWGKDGKVLGEPREGNFASDHDWKYGKTPAGFHPRRVIFGLPHNYGQGPKLEIEGEHHSRRASPLLFHVQALGNERHVGVAVILPATFLPAGEGINAGGRIVPAKPEWSVLFDLFHKSAKTASGETKRFSRQKPFGVEGATLP